MASYHALPARLLPHLPSAWRALTYAELHRRAAEAPDKLWEAIWHATSPTYERTYASARLGGQWFVGARLNAVAHLLAVTREDEPVLQFRNELLEAPLPFGRAELLGQVASFAAYLRDQGIGVGDTVGLYLPAAPETLYAVYAAWSLGARVVYAGIRTAPERAGAFFAAHPTKLLVVADGYRYAGKNVSHFAQLHPLAAGLPDLQRTVLLPYLDPQVRWNELPGTVLWLHTFNAGATTVQPVALPFGQAAFEGIDSPTTYSQGGLLLSALKYLRLDLRLPVGTYGYWQGNNESEHLLAALRAQLAGAVPLLYDGAPDYPNGYARWKTIKDGGVSVAQLSDAGEAMDLSSYQPYGQLKQLLVGTASPSAWLPAQFPGVDIHHFAWDSKRGQLRQWRRGATPYIDDYRADSPVA